VPAPRCPRCQRCHAGLLRATVPGAPSTGRLAKRATHEGARLHFAKFRRANLPGREAEPFGLVEVANPAEFCFMEVDSVGL